MSISIIITDDHSMFAESLAENLIRQGDFKILKLLGNGKELLVHLHFEMPDIILLDYNMPEMDGLQTSNEILKLYPDAKVLVITMHSAINIINPLIKTGIKGIVLKNTSTSELITAIRNLMEGKTYYSQEIIANLTKGFSSAIQFTKREKEIILLLKEGKSTKDIADKLFLSTHTIESHRKNILAKTDTKNTQGMLRVIEENGLL